MKSKLNEVSYILFIAFPSFLFLPKIVSSIAIIILVVINAPSLFSKITWKFVLKSTLIFSVIYFFLHLLSISYTNDKIDGLRHVQGIVSFLILPLIAVSIFNERKLRRSDLRNVLELFVLSSVIALTVCLLMSIYKVQFGNGSWEWWFFYRGLSDNINLHPVYLSYYLNLSLSALLFFSDFKFLKNRTLKFGLILFVILGLILLSSRTPLIVTFIILLVAVLKNVRLKQVKVYGALTILLLVSLFFVAKSERFEQLTSLEGMKSIPRYQTWVAGYQVVSDNLILGIPEGDLDEALYNQYVKNEFEEGIKFKYNCHNQYLQQTGYFGVLGLLFLLYWLFQLIRASKVEFSLFIIIGSICIYLLTENLLSVNKGIIFTSYFFTIISIYERGSRSSSR